MIAIAFACICLKALQLWLVEGQRKICGIEAVKMHQLSDVTLRQSTGVVYCICQIVRNGFVVFSYILYLSECTYCICQSEHTVFLHDVIYGIPSTVFGLTELPSLPVQD